METLQIIQIRQIIKIFLASSKELSNDRYAFGNFVRRLNETYEKRGIRLKLFEWEDYDAAYNNRRKQDEYDDQIRDSDMFLALFRTWAGKFTIEEFDLAVEEFRRTGTKPKNYVYIRDLFDGETETDELTAFKHRLSDEMGYFWIRYNNNDSLHLHFVMQLQLVEGNRIDSLKVENGEVKFEDMTIAQMDNLRFAAGNEEYKRMNQRLAELPGLIEKARMRVENYPNEEDFKDGLQELLNERNQLQKDFDQQQQFLLDTAMRIARLQGEKITDRMRRAMEAFEEGNVHEANIILNEAEHDADRNLTDYRQSKELTEQKRLIVISSIDELFLKTSILMADASIPISIRINQTKGLYAKANQLASEVDYDKEKYSNLLFDYAQFLNKYGFYKDAVEVYFRQIAITEELFGKEDEKSATSYNEIGIVYYNKGDYKEALEYFLKALTAREKILGMEHPDTAKTNDNIGTVYRKQGIYDKALKFMFKALEIRMKNFNTEHCDNAFSYNNIASIYWDQGKYDNALNYQYKVLDIFEKVLGTENPETATIYNNIGALLYALNDFDNALKYHLKALKIREKVLGVEHPDTANSYNNIGIVYWKQYDYDNALKYYLKALIIREQSLGTKHPDTARIYNNIGLVYAMRKNYDEALSYYFKALRIWEKVLDKEHPDIATSYHNIGTVYCLQDYYVNALKYLSKAYLIRQKILGPEHPDTKVTLNWIEDVNKAIKSTPSTNKQ